MIETVLRDAGVDFLEQRARRARRTYGRFRAGEAEAEEELFVLLVELENLQDPRARLLEQVARLRFLGVAGGHGAQRGERGVEFGEELAFAFDEFRGERALVLAEETVLLERALVQLVTKLLVLL